LLKRRGCRNKFAYDPEQSIFALKKVLPAGMVFPYDFGFLPSTLAPDGDPIDVLLLMDEPAFPGCAVKARLVGVIEGERVDGKTTTRNDRLVAVTARKYFVTLRNQAQRMAILSALGTLRKRYCALIEPASSVHQTSVKTSALRQRSWVR
jgi:hypothetical protein